MKTRIENEKLIIQTDRDLGLPFLGRKTQGEYRTFWHFIKDLNEIYPIEDPDPELLEALKKKVEERKATQELGKTWENDGRYEKYLDNGYRQYDFQARAAHFITKQKRVLLADDVGLGKTITTITAFLDLIDQGLGEKFLVVAPASLRLQWLGELRKFVNRDYFPDIEFVVMNAQRKERIRRYRSFIETPAPGIMITSYALLRDDADYMKKLKIDGAALDEGTKIKNRQTKTNKAVREILGSVEYKIALTATPIENGLEDLYCICEWIDRRMLRTKTYFEHRYCVLEDKKIWQGRGKFITVKETTGYKNISDAQQKLTDIMLRRTVEEVSLELPSVINQNITLEMSKAQKDAYAEVKGEIYGKLTKIDLLGQMTYLQEICDAPALVGRSGSGVKVKEFKRLLQEDFKYQKVVAITRFKKFAQLVKKELGKKIDAALITGEVDQNERNLIVEDFEAGSGQKVIIGTTAIEEGLNLQAGSVLINLDMPWNPAKLQQRLGRIRRLGSEHATIRMINLIMEDSIEERVLEVLYEKGEIFEKMFERDDSVKIGALLDMDPEEIKEMV